MRVWLPIKTSLPRREPNMLNVVPMTAARFCGSCWLLGLFLFASPAIGQTDTTAGVGALKISGYGNIVGTAATDQPDGGAGIASQAEIELTPQYRTASGTVFAARAVANIGGAASAAQSSWRLAVPEASVFAIGDFGRIEIGERAGFPQSLIGFTPSEIAFTSPAFGPESGSRLDPDGRLPTSFLPAALASRIDALSYLGYAARFYGDRSFKAIYLTPRSRSGFYGAVSYTPQTSRPSGFDIAEGMRAPVGSPGQSGDPGTYHDVVQAALVWNHRTEALDISLGATYSHAGGGATALDRRSDSFSGGVSATVRDTWTVGLSGTVDDVTGRLGGRGAPYGVVASADYVRGPWVLGGYYQHASANGQTVLPARDTVDIGEIGLSYLFDRDHDSLGQNFHTDAKLFASLYVYRLQSDADQSTTRARGEVLLIGARFSFY